VETWSTCSGTTSMTSFPLPSKQQTSHTSLHNKYGQNGNHLVSIGCLHVITTQSQTAICKWNDSHFHLLSSSASQHITYLSNACIHIKKVRSKHHFSRSRHQREESWMLLSTTLETCLFARRLPMMFVHEEK
jgi:hypothetical protein